MTTETLTKPITVALVLGDAACDAFDEIDLDSPDPDLLDTITTDGSFQTFTFATEGERRAFLAGAEIMLGWSDYVALSGEQAARLEAFL
jgi:hypothetical protein